MKRLFEFAALALLLAGCSARHFQKTDGREIVILYDNDVHCNVDGYAVANAMKKAELAKGSDVLLLSAGDFVNGGSLGAISKGGYIVSIMNQCDYDAVTLGNHEFDFGMERMNELAGMLKTEVLCCNFESLPEGKLLFKPYDIFEKGGRKIAVIGIATPSSFVSSTPSNFQDGDGNFIYSLHPEDLCERVQSYVDEVRAKGADYVIALSHLGDDVAIGVIGSPDLIAGTTGIDVVLDGHSHSLIPGRWMKNKSGGKTLLTSTGAYFQHVGKLTISPDGKISSELTDPKSFPWKDTRVYEVTEAIKDEYEQFSSSYVGRSKAEMVADNDEGPRIARREESGLGDFCADAIRAVAGSDMAICGGGSIRAALHAGEVTFNDIFRVFPFLNNIVVAEVSGQTILDALEYSVASLPGEFGGFLQVSGITFTVKVQVDSPVTIDKDQLFAGFAGPRRRVCDVMVEKDGEYVPIDPKATYSVAGSAYTLQNKGDGYTMFGTRIKDIGILDVNVLEIYIKDNLKGEIPMSYSRPQKRIRIIY